MPYLDPIGSYEDFAHLTQLYLAAHPDVQADNATLRARTGLTDEYFYSLPVLVDLVRWARARHMITRQTAQFMQARHAWLFAQPGEKITLGRHVLGIPPRLQPTITDQDMLRWVALSDDVTPEPDARAYTLEAAIRLLEAMAADATVDPVVQGRARHLIDWLETQMDADA